MEDKTKIGLFLYLVGGPLGLATGILTTNPTLLGDGCASGGTGVLLSLLGFLLIYWGRREFGREHRVSVERALTLWLVAMVILVVIMVVAVILMPVASPGAGWLFYGMGLLNAIVSAMLMYYLLRHLQDGFGHNVLIWAVVVSVCATALGLFTTGVGQWQENLAETKEGEEGVEEVVEGFSPVHGILGAVGSILFLVAAGNALMRIHNGQLVPVSPPTAKGGQRHPCPGCGHTMRLLRTENKWWCENCGRSY